MAVTVSNLIQGPATLYWALFGAAEPLDTALTTAPAAGVWNDFGGTQDGVQLVIDQTYNYLEVDQIIEDPEARLVDRKVSIKTNLAEATLANLARAINVAPPTVPSAGLLALEPLNDNSATQPLYAAILLDGYAPGGFRRRVIGRKALQVGSVAGSYKKDDQTLWPAEFKCHYVSPSIKSFRVLDQTA